MLRAEKFIKKWNRVQDVTMHLIRQIPPDKLDFRPRDDMRTIKELVTHLYMSENIILDSASRGRISPDDWARCTPPAIETLEDLLGYAKKIHDQTNETLSQFTEEDMIRKKVRVPWGDVSVFDHVFTAYEHLWHHRGQLYLYLKLAGVRDMVFLYDLKQTGAR